MIIKFDTYNESLKKKFINESIRDKLKGKSDDDIYDIVRKKLGIDKKIISVKVRTPLTGYTKHRFDKGMKIYDLDYKELNHSYRVVTGKSYNILKFIEAYFGYNDESRSISYIKELMINESLKDKLKGKSEEEVLSNIKDLHPYQKLIKGCQYGIIPLVKDSIDNGLPIIHIESGLSEAAAYGQLDVVKYILDNTSVNPGFFYSEPLRMALDQKQFDVVKYLLKDKRVDPSIDNNGPLRNSIDNGYLDIVKLLLKNKKVVDKLNTNKSLKRYKEQIEKLNESLKDKLKGKSDDELEIVVKDLDTSTKLKQINHP